MICGISVYNVQLKPRGALFPSAFCFERGKIMNKKKTIILGISNGLLDVILLLLTAGICLFLIFMAVIRLTSPKPVEPEDDLARLICESLGEGFVYDGMYIQRDSVRVYDIDVYTGDSESVHLPIDKINDSNFALE